MKIILFLAVAAFAHLAQAKYDYCYIGTGKVIAAEAPAQNRIQATLQITEFHKTYRSKTMSGSAAKELVKNQKYAGDFAAVDRAPLQIDEKVYFRAGWDCDGAKCTAKDWALLTEEEAKGQSIVREKVCSPYLH